MSAGLTVLLSSSSLQAVAVNASYLSIDIFKSKIHDIIKYITISLKVELHIDICHFPQCEVYAVIAKGVNFFEIFRIYALGGWKFCKERIVAFTLVVVGQVVKSVADIDKSAKEVAESFKERSALVMLACKSACNGLHHKCGRLAGKVDACCFFTLYFILQFHCVFNGRGKIRIKASRFLIGLFEKRQKRKCGKLAF